MPAQAPTPRSTRNSCGLRGASVSSADSNGERRLRSRVVQRRRREKPSPIPRQRELAVTTVAATVADQPTTPSVGRDSSRLPTIGEESPATAELVAVASSPEDEELVAPEAAGASPVVESNYGDFTRVTALLPRALPTFRRTLVTFPETFARSLRDKFVSGLVSNAPEPARLSSHDSPGYETLPFAERKDQEGHKFARELYVAIREDHSRRECSCGFPAIYNSLKEAKEGSGHLRFYTAHFRRNNLRVLQSKDNLRWHCTCNARPSVHPLYQEHFKTGRKRPATDSEFELIAHNGGGELQTPMWWRAAGKIAAMGASVIDFVGKLLPRFVFGTTRHEAVESRVQDSATNQVVVKRFKRQHCVPYSTQSRRSLGKLGVVPEVRWAADPTLYIGKSSIETAIEFFKDQLENAKAGRLMGGRIWNDVLKNLRPNDDLHLTATIHLIIGDFYGAINVGDDPDEAHEKFCDATRSYIKALDDLISFLHAMYLDPAEFERFRSLHPVPPMPFRLADLEWRQRAAQSAGVLVWLMKKREDLELHPEYVEVLTKIIADAKAVHKQEYPPSWVKEVPVDEDEVDPTTYALKYPEPSQSIPEVQNAQTANSKPIRPQSRTIPKLEPSALSTNAALPTHHSPPPRKRKIAFESPVAQYNESLWKKATKSEPVFNQKAADKAEESLHGAKHTGFLDAMRQDLPAQSDSQQKDKHKAAIRVVTDAERDSEREIRRKLDEEMRRVYEFKRGLRAKLAAYKENPVMTPESKRKALNEPPKDVDTPENYKFLDAPHDSRHPLGRVQPLRVGELGNIQQITSLSPAERRHAIDIALACGSIENEARHAAVPNPFFDVDDALEVATNKFTAIELDRQVIDEFVDDILAKKKEKEQRELQERIRRKEERERQRAEAERRRQEERLKRLEEERRRLEEEERRKAAEEAAARGGLRAPFAPLITNISPKWNDKVIGLRQAHPATELCKTLEQQPLTRRDFEEKLLPPTAWLNDNVIIGLILYVADYINKKAGAAEGSPKCAAFTSYFYPRLSSAGPTQCGRLMRRAGVRKGNFFDIETILIPICEDSHWTLAVVRPQLRTVAHMDSMKSGHGHPAVKHRILDWVKTTLEEKFDDSEWKTVDYDAPTQNNGWDCGVFAITNAMCLSLGVNPMEAYTANQLRVQRSRLAAVLLNEGFKGDFSLDEI